MSIHSKTILPNFTPIGFETKEPWAFLAAAVVQQEEEEEET